MTTRHSAFPSSQPTHTIEQSLNTALNFLQKSQLPHGEFRTQAAKNAAMTTACVFDSSPFTTAFVLYSIGFYNDARTESMIAKGLKFLQDEKEGRGLWRYWSSRNVAHHVLPPDLDDIACISFLLRKHNLFIDNKEFLLENRSEDGLYYTWLAPRNGMRTKLKSEIQRLTHGSSLLLFSVSGTLHNVDPAVNANVLLYLGEREETRSAIHYVVKSVDDAKLPIDSYYSDLLVFYYLVSRAFYQGVTSLGQTCETILNTLMVRKKNDGSFGNELLTALAVCTLINFGKSRDTFKDSITFLLQSQKCDGAWRRAPMWLGPAPYYGSEELSTALCFEALARYYC